MVRQFLPKGVERESDLECAGSKRVRNTQCADNSHGVFLDTDFTLISKTINKIICSMGTYAKLYWDDVFCRFMHAFSIIPNNCLICVIWRRIIRPNNNNNNKCNKIDVKDWFDCMYYILCPVHLDNNDNSKWCEHLNNNKNRRKSPTKFMLVNFTKNILPLHETGDDPLIATFGRYTALTVQQSNI